MIFIDNSKISHPPNWQKDAKSLTKKMIPLSDVARKRLIKKNAQMWTKLRPELERISCKKC